MFLNSQQSILLANLYLFSSIFQHFISCNVSDDLQQEHQCKDERREVTAQQKDVTDGKKKEKLLRFTHMIKAFCPCHCGPCVLIKL